MLTLDLFLNQFSYWGCLSPEFTWILVTTQGDLEIISALRRQLAMSCIAIALLRQTTLLAFIITQVYTCVVIPDFDTHGNLPSGHEADWSEVEKTPGFLERRVQLLKRLYQGLVNLKGANCQTAYLDGTFASNKENPGDVDVCYNPRGTIGAKLDSVFLDFSNLRAAQKAKNGRDFFPSSATASLNPRLSYREFFQKDKYIDEAKGIIALDLRRLP